MNFSSTLHDSKSVCLFTSSMPILWRKYRVGRSRLLTLLTSNLGRRFITRLISEPGTWTSRWRKVKTGMRSETWVVRISGHMPTIRRNSIAVKSKEVMYSTVDLMSAREVVITVGWFSISKKESIPMDSRYRSFFWKPVSLGGIVCFGHLHFITCSTAEAQEFSRCWYYSLMNNLICKLIVHSLTEKMKLMCMYRR